MRTAAVEGDFCQSCINQLLGKYCRIKIDEPFDSAAAVTDNPEKIYQRNQLDLAEQANAFSDRISRTTADILGRRDSTEINPGS
jgi:hypothetical protein